MRGFRFVIVGRKFLCVAAAAALFPLAASVYLICFFNLPAAKFEDPGSGIIVIDPGHGGVDGGACRDGMLEKDINLEIAAKLRTILENRGYKVLLTRDRDVSLDSLSHSGGSRHARDLRARVDIINASGAQLFISIHANCVSNGSADGSLVFYGRRFEQSRTLAESVQRSLNSLEVDGAERTKHAPQEGRYYILGHSDIPGVIVETAFLSSARERELLKTDEFKRRLAAAIAEGVRRYLGDMP